MHSQKKNLIIFLVLFLLVIGAYSSNYSASWHFDDYPNIVDNKRIQIKDLGFNTLKETFYREFDNGQNLSGRVSYRE